jgi:hypothetical protein
VGRLLCICQVPRQCCLRLEQGTWSVLGVAWCVCSVTFRPGFTTRSSTCSSTCSYSRSWGWSRWSAQLYTQLFLLAFALMQLYMQLYLLVFAPMELEFVETDTRWALHLSGTAPGLPASRAGQLEVVHLLCICQVPRQCCLHLEQGTWRWCLCSVTPCSSACSSTCSCSRPSSSSLWKQICAGRCVCQVPRQCCLRLEHGTWRWCVCSVTPCSCTCSCSRP